LVTGNDVLRIWRATCALSQMNALVCFAYAVGDITVPRLIAQESAALVVLVASLVVFRTFRERYLLVWILGWLAYFVSRLGMGSGALQTGDGYSVVLSQAEFVVAVCLFSASLLVYAHARKLLWALLPAGGAIVAFAVARQLVWPDSSVLRLVLEVSYRLVALVAAVQLIRYRWGRSEMGPWLLAVALLCLHLDWAPLNAHLPLSFGLMADLLLGLSMLLIVFDDSKVRMHRLAVINSLTDSIARAQQYGPMMATALEELKALTGAKAAWFRLLEGQEMVITQQIGLSWDFLRDRTSVPKDDNFESTLSGTGPIVVKTSSSEKEVQNHLRGEGFHHCVITPVRGKKAIIGTLTLGSGQKIHYTPEEMEFLATTAHQLGLAVENLRLLEQIMRSHRQWTNTFDSIQDVVLLHDASFHIMKANRALLQRINRAPADVIGTTCESSLPRTHGNWSGCPYCHAGESFSEGPDACFGGVSLVSTSTYVDQSSQQKGTIHVVRDVTERHLAEEKYRLLFEQVQEGVFVATPEGKLLDCNDAFIRMLGYSSRKEVMALQLDAEVYSSAERREAFRREVELHNYVRNFEVTLRRKDGTVLVALESSFATRDGQGKVERYQGFLLDVSETKRAENEIRRRNRELNALNAIAMIATQSFDLDEILNLTLRQVTTLLGADAGAIYILDADETTFRRRAQGGQQSQDDGRSAEVRFPEGFGELVTRSRTEVLTSEYLPHLPAAVAAFIAAGQPTSWTWVLLWGKDQPLGMMGISSGSSRAYTGNDENLLVATGRQLAMTIEKVNLYEATCRAYEDLRRTQEQLLQSEKMSAVGQLISGVAHELNNPLTAILGYAQLLESENLSERSSDFVGKLYKQAQRTHRVVQNLLSFARQRKPQKQRVDVRKVLDETLALRDYDLRVSNIHLEREIEPNLPAVTADPHQLEQVFLNIINNAVDAMLETGKGGKLKVRMYAQDGAVHAEFQDSGPGIKEPKRIFDPFYTTKSVGKGTGLGLSICYGIIKEHGGEISAFNHHEGGAVIKVCMPSAGWGESTDKIAGLRREAAVEGHILLVEDEEAVLEFERDVLTGAGAQVTTAMTADEMQHHLGAMSFDALIVTGRLPGGWGAQDVFRWLAENHPGMEKRVLFTFSNVAAPEIRDFLQQNNLPSLVKPFEIGDLLLQSRRLLQKTRAAVAGR
jgi:PAS domain S-box-containing protein